MGKSRFLSIAFAVTVFSVSCAPSITRSGDYGRITIAFGETASGGRIASTGIETGWPGGALPIFSSVTVKVSAPDMSTVTASASGSSGSLTVQVPAGAGRLVELVAVPAAGSTAPYFAKAYSGSTSIDIGEGETKSVTITLALAETKIALCSATSQLWNWNLAVANSLTETPSLGAEVSLYFYSDIDYDEHGRLFVSSDNRGIQRFSSLTEAAESVQQVDEDLVGGLAYQKSSGRLYFTRLLPESGMELVYIEMGSGEIHTVDLPASDLQMISAIAADDSAVYIGMGGVSEVPFANATVIQKVFVGVGGAASFGPAYSLEIPVEPLAMLFVQDMIVKDGMLYVAANNMLALLALLTVSSEQVPDDVSGLLANGRFGKIIALDAATLGYRGAIDWSPPPGLSAQPTDVYCGPLRFLGFGQGKLYAADAGIQLTLLQDDEVSMVIPSAIVGRVVEMDTTTLKISRTGPSGSAMPLEWMAEGTD